MPGLRRRGIDATCPRLGLVPEDGLDPLLAPRNMKANDMLIRTAVAGDSHLGPLGTLTRLCRDAAGTAVRPLGCHLRLLACAGRPSLEPDNGPGQGG